jgi:hypothetical protein
MRNKLKAFILGTFVTDLRSDRHDLEEAKRELDHDRSHHASHHKLTEDEARIKDIEHDIYADRR